LGIISRIQCRAATKDEKNCRQERREYLFNQKSLRQSPSYVIAGEKNRVLSLIFRIFKKTHPAADRLL